MNFKKLRDEFKDKAKDIRAEKKETSNFRARSYERVAEILESYYDLKETVTKSKIQSLPITEYMKNKAIYFLDNNKGKFIDNKDSSIMKTKNTTVNDTQLKTDLINLMGIGTEKAQRLIDDGLKNITDLRMKKWKLKLPEETKAWLEYKPSKGIPNSDIKEIEYHLLKMNSRNRELIFVGSYRRNKPISNDIDIMIISDDDDAIDKFMKDLNKKLKNKAYPYSKGIDKLSVIIDVKDLLKKRKKTVYKLDTFRVKPKNKIPMLLYSTGSKSNNIKMRARAKKLGMMLNQKGLFKKIDNKLIKIPNLNSEKDYYRILGMKYKEPNERI